MDVTKIKVTAGYYRTVFNHGVTRVFLSVNFARLLYLQNSQH